MKNIRSLLVYFLILLSACSQLDAQNIVAPEEFEKMLKASDSPQLVDVRTKEEFAQGFIQGAKNIDFYDASFKDNLKQLDKTKPVYIYCRSGGRSSKAVKILEVEGFKKIYELKGGILNWQSKNLAIVK